MQRGACLPRRGFDRFERGEAERAETGFHFLVGNVRAMTRRISARVTWIFFAARCREKYQQRQRAIRRRQAAESIQPHGARQARPFPDRRAAKRVDASVCNFRKRAARRMATGSNQAHSIKTFFVENEISVSARP